MDRPVMTILRRAARIGSRYWPAYCVLIAMIMATAWTSGIVRDQAITRNRLRFDLKFETIRQNLALDLQYQRNLLESARSLFAASRSVESDEWAIFVRGVTAGSNDVLLEEVCYVEPVGRQRLSEFLSTVGAEGQPNFNITPPGEREDYFLARFLDPRDQNSPWAGFDFGSCPNSRAAADRARDTGFITATGTHEMPSASTSVRGIVVFAPIYQNGRPIRTVGDRREALTGWGVSVIQIENLIGKLAATYNTVGMALVEGVALTPGQGLSVVDPKESKPEGAAKSKYTLSTSLNFAGSNWTLIAWPHTTFFPVSQNVVPTLVIVIGLLLSVLCGGATVLLLARRACAINSAQRAADSLGRCDTMLKAVIENASDGFMILDRSHRITYASTGAHGLLLGAFDDLYGRPIAEIIPGDGGRALEEDCQRVFSDGGRVTREILVPGPVEVWLEFGVARAGEGASVSFRDVTDRRRTLDLLRESEERFRLAIHNSPVTVFSHDLELRYTWVYNAVPEHPESAALGRTDADLLPKEYAGPLMEIKRRALDTEREVRAEVAFPTGPKGTLRTYDLRAAPQRDGHGRVIGITCVATDVTDKKSIETAMRESEAKYRHLFEGSADGIFVMTDTFRECNDRVCEMWACSREDLIGHTPAEFSPPLQPNGRPSDEAARDMIEGALAGASRCFRWTHRRKDGVLIDTEISLKAVSLAGEQVLLATVRDVTAQVRREERLAREAAESAALAELLTAVLASSSRTETSRLVIEHAQRITDSEMGFAGYLDPATGHLVVPSINQTTGDGKRFSTGETVFETFHGPWAKSLVDRVPALSNAPIQEPAESGGSFGRVPIRRYLSAPAVIGGELVGLLALANSRRDYSERDLSRVKHLASIYARAIRRLPNDAEDRAAPKAA